ncbi:MAG TPA: hypothetical protein VFK38_04445 [Candidatus Limnocylindrales bacterium]|nr:hypothetical protein [Candidatus Limnocylindrales bacterium]
MTGMTQEARRLEIILDEGQRAQIEFLDSEEERLLREQLGEIVRVRIAAAEEADTEGHLLRYREPDRATVRIILGDDDDTEGHALSLRFGSAEDAQRFRTRLLAAGVLAGTIAVAGAMGANAPRAAAPDAGIQGAAPAAQQAAPAGGQDEAEPYQPGGFTKR